VNSHYIEAAMTDVTATDANRYFSKLLQRVENGEHITITKDGRPVAVMMPAAELERRAVALERLKLVMQDGSGFSIRHKGRLRDQIYRK
jgi:prevent-host-death family protein